MSEVLTASRVIAEITATADSVRVPLSENEANNLILDAILDFKTYLIGLTHKLDKAVLGVNELTWIGKQKASVQEIEDSKRLVLAARELHKLLVKVYANRYRTFKERGIAVEEIKAFKHSVDELKEVTYDYESTVLIFPNDKDIRDLNQRLSNL